jgi:hypothetical protein
VPVAVVIAVAAVPVVIVVATVVVSSASAAMVVVVVRRGRHGRQQQRARERDRNPQATSSKRHRRHLPAEAFDSWLLSSIRLPQESTTRVRMRHTRVAIPPRVPHLAPLRATSAGGPQ